MAVRFRAGLLVLLCVLCGIAYARADDPGVGFCIATNGTTAETTILDGGGAFYPAPQVRVEQTDQGFAVEARVEWRRG
jgi:hypothetical protein